jgi:NAD(P)-dependent dehydrogenase (short-subunit alcohol dehydrogenase family)
VEDLTGKVAVVTGGARGVGLGLAEALVESGMRVVLADLDGTALERATAALEGAGAEAFGMVADVTDPAAVGRLRDAALEHFGRVDVLCNNAATGAGGPLSEPIDIADWEFTMRAAVYSVLNGLNAFLPHMLERGSGHVVNTASRQGLVPSPLLGAYPPAKAAVICLSEMLHADLAARQAGVGVTVLTPGGVRSPALLDTVASYVDGDADAPQLQAFLTDRAAAAVEPIELGRLVVRAIRADALYVNTHLETLAWLQERVDRMRADAQRIGTVR